MRFKRLEEMEIRGTISSSDKSIEDNKLIEATLDFIKRLKL